MIIVTGGAGFIGSNLVKALNDDGREDLLVVDNLTNTAKVRNLADCRIHDYVDKTEFVSLLERDAALGDVQAVFHQGACSDTMASDGHYVMENNFTFSKSVLRWCQRRRAPLIYASSASVYGAGRVFKESPEYELPLNAYAFSKLVFDNHVRALLQAGARSQVAGLRYFNVYGPREFHKQRMASVALHFYRQFLDSETVALFQGSGGYADGEQRRDFISVADVVEVNLFFLQHPEISGIFNVGTGRAGAFNEVAATVINALRRRGKHPAPLNLDALRNQNLIRYIPMPEALHGAYQSFTEADISSLRNAGYTAPFRDIPAGIDQYIDWLEQELVEG